MGANQGTREGRACSRAGVVVRAGEGGMRQEGWPDARTLWLCGAATPCWLSLLVSLANAEEVGGVLQVKQDLAHLRLLCTYSFVNLFCTVAVYRTLRSLLVARRSEASAEGPLAAPDAIFSSTLFRRQK